MLSELIPERWYLLLWFMYILSSSVFLLMVDSNYIKSVITQYVSLNIAITYVASLSNSILFILNTVSFQVINKKALGSIKSKKLAYKNVIMIIMSSTTTVFRVSIESYIQTLYHKNGISMVKI